MLEFGKQPQNPQRRIPRQPSSPSKELGDSPRRRPPKPRSALQRFLGKLLQSDRRREFRNESRNESKHELRPEAKNSVVRPGFGRPTAVELPPFRAGQSVSARQGIKPFDAASDRPISRRQIPAKRNLLASLLPRTNRHPVEFKGGNGDNGGKAVKGSQRSSALDPRAIDLREGRRPLQSVAQSLRSPQVTASVESVESVEAEIRTHRVRRPHRPHIVKPPSRPVSAWVQAVRLLIVGVGLGAIAGTTMSVLEPSLKTRPATVKTAAIASTVGGQTGSQTVTLKTNGELTDLTAKLGAIARETPDMTAGVFVMDLATGEYASHNGTNVFPAASTIKVPLLVAFLQDVDAGKIRLDNMMAIQPDDIAEGSGDLQHAPPGSKYQALDIATVMIINSDNTATNMIIRQLGGIETVNQRFKQWGLQQTKLSNRLPDVEGTNSTSPQELSTLLSTVNQGGLLTMTGRDRLMSIMRATVNDSLIPQTLGEGALIAHKTGDIGSMLADTGMVDLANGKRYLISVMVKRPHNDDRAAELIHRLSGEINQRFAATKAAEPQQ